MKNLIMVVLLLTFATSAFARRFDDVPKTHWAYDAINQITPKESILQGANKFHGERNLNRFQIAIITNNFFLKKKFKYIQPPPKPGWDNYNLEKLQVKMKDLRAELNKTKERLNEVEVSVGKIKSMDN